MPLIKNGRLADDPWVHVADADDLPLGVQAVVSLDRWQNEHEALVARNAPIGIRLKSDQSPALIADDLELFDLVALEFPKFTDGRAYSSARLLRERYGYTGELRAVGGVLQDQFLFMHRCGFDAYEVADGKAAEAWLRALSEISVTYQPAADGQLSAIALRHRQAKAANGKNGAQKAPSRPVVASGVGYAAPPTPIKTRDEDWVEQWAC